jgi:hypothetical protein
VEKPSSCRKTLHASLRRNRDERLAWGLMIDTSPATEQTNPANEDVKLDNHLLHFNFLPPNCTKSFGIFPGSIKKGFSIFFSSYLHSSMVYPPLIIKKIILMMPQVWLSQKICIYSVFFIEGGSPRSS